MPRARKSRQGFVGDPSASTTRIVASPDAGPLRRVAPMRIRGGHVYFSDGGTPCPACRRPRTACTCPQGGRAPTAKADEIVRVGRATQGRKGKGVTTVSRRPVAFGGPRSARQGAQAPVWVGWGTLKGGVIEIQGEHRDRLVGLLQAKGWTVSARRLTPGPAFVNSRFPAARVRGPSLPCSADRESRVRPGPRLLPRTRASRPRKTGTTSLKEIACRDGTWGVRVCP